MCVRAGYSSMAGDSHLIAQEFHLQHMQIRLLSADTSSLGTTGAAGTTGAVHATASGGPHFPHAHMRQRIRLIAHVLPQSPIHQPEQPARPDNPAHADRIMGHLSICVCVRVRVYVCVGFCQCKGSAVSGAPSTTIPQNDPSQKVLPSTTHLGTDTRHRT